MPELTIAPAILVSTFEEFTTATRKIEGYLPYGQIDVMDGQFVPARSFEDVEKINTLDTKLQWELHLMVNHPLAEMTKWATIKNVWRVIFHIESHDAPLECIEFARSHNWQVGIALNPDTPLAEVEPYFSQLNVVQFMTVYPGQYGAPFVPKVGQKIQAFTKLSPRPLCAVDGAVSAATIPLLKSWGVEIFNAGSALMKARDVQKAYLELQQVLK